MRDQYYKWQILNNVHSAKILRQIFWVIFSRTYFAGLEVCGFATPETQREYSSNFLVSVLVERVMWASVYILHLLEVAKNDFVFNVIGIYGEWKTELVK
jgi:hypothetical protein